MNLGLSLFRLQTLDSAINQIRNRIDAIDQTIRNTDKLKKAEDDNEFARVKLEECNALLRQKTNQVEATRMKFKFNQNALFGGKISNSKELRDLEMEAASLQKLISAQENDQLDQMIVVEEAQNLLASAETHLQDEVARKSESNAHLLGEKMKLESDLPGLLEQRQAIVGNIPAPILSSYSGLLISKNGTAVVEVLDDACSACGSELTPAEQQAARSPASLMRCKTCGRILFKS